MLALTLSGRAPEITLLWLDPTIIEAPDKVPEEMNSHDDSLLRHMEMEGGIEPKHAILIDYLTAETPSLGENDMHEDNDEQVLPVGFIWEVPKVQLTCFMRSFIFDINRM